MLQVLSNTWALLLGMFLLMIGNGLQGTLLGVRGEIEGFSNLEMSIVMSAYFVGFLGASRAVPEMIRRVGHVRLRHLGPLFRRFLSCILRYRIRLHGQLVGPLSGFRFVGSMSPRKVG
jgi:MFS family permease